MKFIKILGVAVGAAAAVFAASLAVKNPGNSAETSENSDVTSLLTRRYKTAEDLPAVVERIESLAAGQTTYGRNWNIVDSRTKDNSATLKFEVPVVIFTDDLEINVNFPSSDEFIVNVRSASRVGSSDFGENKRHVAQILAAMDSAFGNK